VSVSRPIRREFVVKLRELNLKRPAGALAFLLTSAIPAGGDAVFSSFSVSKWRHCFRPVSLVLLADYSLAFAGGNPTLSRSALSCSTSRSRRSTSSTGLAEGTNSLALSFG
jgi:hypothetical protein